LRRAGTLSRALRYRRINQEGNSSLPSSASEGFRKIRRRNQLGVTHRSKKEKADEGGPYFILGSHSEGSQVETKRGKVWPRFLK